MLILLSTYFPYYLIFRVVNLSPFKNIIDSRTTAGTEVELNGVSLLQGDNAILGR